MIKKLKATLFCAVIGFATTQIGMSAYLVGSVHPGAPASLEVEMGYVQTLLGMGANSTQVISKHTYRTFSYDAPVVELTGAVKFDTETPGTVSNYQFVLGKYGLTSWVWELAPGEEFTLPSKFKDKNNKGGGLSHYTVFNGTTRQVPDGGTSIALLGMALLGLGGIRKVLAKF